MRPNRLALVSRHLAFHAYIHAEWMKKSKKEQAEQAGLSRQKPISGLIEKNDPVCSNSAPNIYLGYTAEWKIASINT